MAHGRRFIVFLLGRPFVPRRARDLSKSADRQCYAMPGWLGTCGDRRRRVIWLLV